MVDPQRVSLSDPCPRLAIMQHARGLRALSGQRGALGARNVCLAGAARGAPKPRVRPLVIRGAIVVAVSTGAQGTRCPALRCVPVRAGEAIDGEFAKMLDLMRPAAGEPRARWTRAITVYSSSYVQIEAASSAKDASRGQPITARVLLVGDECTAAHSRLLGAGSREAHTLGARLTLQGGASAARGVNFPSIRT